MGVHNTEAYPAVKKLLGIPDDEPIFILRGQDRFTLPTIQRYYNIARSSEAVTEEWLDRVAGDMEPFEKFRGDNPDRIKTPD